jgi:hypothetical protein
MALPVTKAASSRSLLVRGPLLVAEARWLVIDVGNGARQTVGGVGRVFAVVGSQKPPMPAFEASVAPTKVGAIGTREVSGTGCVDVVAARWFQSAKAWWRIGVSRIRGPVWSVNACWRMENRCFALYKAVAMLRSSPRVRCHFFRDTRFCLWRAVKMV